MTVDWAGALLVGRYRLGRRVGGGGMGAVHEARDERVGRRVAVKVLHPELARERQHIARFLREAKAAAGLLHPHIVQVLDVSGSEGEGPPFLVMEFLSGQSLARMRKDEKKLAPGRVVRLARQLLSALGAAHRVGIVHRDMKPGNIIVQRGYDGREIAKIVDFGIAKLMDTRSYSRLTATGEVLGTPTFMSPEQLSGEEVDGRADLYGVASIIYDCIVGEPAVGSGPLVEIAQRALTGDHPILATVADVHPGLSEVVERALAVDPNARYPDAEAMSEALAPFEDPTDALLVPEHRLPHPATRMTPSVRPEATIPTTSERPPSASGSGVAIPATGERPPSASGSKAAIPATTERPPSASGSKAAIPATGERPPSSAGAPRDMPPRGEPPPSANASVSGAVHAQESPRRRGLFLAALAFIGCLLGAGAVATYVLFVRRDAGAAQTPPVQPSPTPPSSSTATPPPAPATAAAPTSPSTEPPLQPMMPSTGPAAVVPAPLADPNAAPAGETH